MGMFLLGILATMGVAALCSFLFDERSTPQKEPWKVVPQGEEFVIKNHRGDGLTLDSTERLGIYFWSKSYGYKWATFSTREEASQFIVEKHPDAVISVKYPTKPSRACCAKLAFYKWLSKDCSTGE